MVLLTVDHAGAASHHWRAARSKIFAVLNTIRTILERSPTMHHTEPTNIGHSEYLRKLRVGRRLSLSVNPVHASSAAALTAAAEAEKLGNSGRVILTVDEGQEVDFRLQGNAELNTADAFARRKQLRRDKHVFEALHEFWTAVLRSVRTSDYERNTVNFEEYSELHKRITMTLVDGPDEAAIEEDWHNDLKGNSEMTRELLCDAMFELADTWTSSIDADQYVHFLRELLNSICEQSSDGDLVIWQWRPSVQFNEKLAEEFELAHTVGSAQPAQEQGSESTGCRKGPQRIAEKAEKRKATIVIQRNIRKNMARHVADKRRAATQTIQKGAKRRIAKQKQVVTGNTDRLQTELPEGANGKVGTLQKWALRSGYTDIERSDDEPLWKRQARLSSSAVGKSSCQLPRCNSVASVPRMPCASSCQVSDESVDNVAFGYRISGVSSSSPNLNISTRNVSEGRAGGLISNEKSRSAFLCCSGQQYSQGSLGTSQSGARLPQLPSPQRRSPRRLGARAINERLGDERAPPGADERLHFSNERLEYERASPGADERLHFVRRAKLRPLVSSRIDSVTRMSLASSINPKQHQIIEKLTSERDSRAWRADAFGWAVSPVASAWWKLPPVRASTSRHLKFGSFHTLRSRIQDADERHIACDCCRALATRQTGVAHGGQTGSSHRGKESEPLPELAMPTSRLLTTLYDVQSQWRFPDAVSGLQRIPRDAKDTDSALLTKSRQDRNVLTVCWLCGSSMAL